MMKRFAVAAVALMASATHAANEQTDFYPDQHFDYVHKVTDADSLNSFVQDNIHQDKTVFVRWIASPM